MDSVAYWLHPSQYRTGGATSSTSFTGYAVPLQGLVHTSLTIFLQACDAVVLPMNSCVPQISTEPPRVVVASPEQVSAANRRRTNAVPGRFVCNLCPQNFTAKHNLKSQSYYTASLFFRYRI